MSLNSYYLGQRLAIEKRAGAGQIAGTVALEGAKALPWVGAPIAAGHGIYDLFKGNWGSAAMNFGQAGLGLFGLGALGTAAKAGKLTGMTAKAYRAAQLANKGINAAKATRAGAAAAKGINAAKATATGAKVMRAGRAADAVGTKALTGLGAKANKYVSGPMSRGIGNAANKGKGVFTGKSYAPLTPKPRTNLDNLQWGRDIGIDGIGLARDLTKPTTPTPGFANPGGYSGKYHNVRY